MAGTLEIVGQTVAISSMINDQYPAFLRLITAKEKVTKRLNGLI